MTALSKRKSTSLHKLLIVVVVSITLLALILPNSVNANQFSSTNSHTFVSTPSKRRRTSNKKFDQRPYRGGASSISGGGVDDGNGFQNNHHRELLDNSNDRRVIQARKSHLNTVAWVAFANFLVYTFRPDKSIVWQMRIPRACWELSILFVAKSASVSPTLLLLLSMMTATTAIVDIFIWAPLFASFSTFETCTGGWFTGKPHQCVSDYSKGFSRLFVSMQSLFGGLFYLLTTVIAWNEFSSIRQETKIRRQVSALHGLIQQHNQGGNNISSTFSDNQTTRLR